MAATNSINNPSETMKSKRYIFDRRKDKKGKIYDALKRIWHQINLDYKSAENCPLELQQDMIGEKISIEGFVGNSNRKKFEVSFANAIQAI